MTEATNPCYLCGERPADGELGVGSCATCRVSWNGGAAEALQDEAQTYSAEELSRFELRELVRSAQHHIDRSWPQACEWLNRALDVLGRDTAFEGGPHLHPKSIQTKKEQPPNEHPSQPQREH